MPCESILIVDDNATNLKLARVILAAVGFEIATAGDAGEALAQLDMRSPDLVLMDVQLPGMDGLELTRRIKGDPRHRQVLVVALTAYAMKGDEERARAAGCDGYITKPIDPDTFADTVAAHLRARSVTT